MTIQLFRSSAPVALSILMAMLTVVSQSGCHRKHKPHILVEINPTAPALANAHEIEREFDEIEKKTPRGEMIIMAEAPSDHVAELAKAELGTLEKITTTAQSPASSHTQQSVKTVSPPPTDPISNSPLRKLKGLEVSGIEFSNPSETPLIFDIPVTYNERVKQWIRYFQSGGRITFKNWLQRSSRYLPIVQYELARSGLPQDLAFVAMIESGFTPGAVSHAGAKGMWQFIIPTAERYGLQIDWWIDERKDFHKATQAAIRYMGDLYQQFNSWYLVAASYNMGENGVRRLIQRHKTNNYWELAERGALPQETSDYVPKIIAAMLIAKAPALYGFRELEYQMPLSFETASVPGGTDILNLASFLGVSEKYLKDLNPELTKGFIPTTVRAHNIRIPKGSMLAVSQFIRMQAQPGIKRTAAN